MKFAMRKLHQIPRSESIFKLIKSTSSENSGVFVQHLIDVGNWGYNMMLFTLN